MENPNLSYGIPTPVPRTLQAEIASQLRSATIALRDILFELTEVKARHDHDLHELKAIVRRREAESHRLMDAIHLLRDLQATIIHLSPPATPAPPVCSEADRDGTVCGELEAAQFLNGAGI